MTRPAAPPADWAEPVAPAAGSTAANPEMDSPEPPKDSYEARFKAMQADSTRRAQENATLRAKLARYETEAGDDTDDAEDEVDEPAPSRFRAAESRRPRVPESERPDLAAHDPESAELGRSVAEAVHGRETVEAYDKAMAMLSAATTEADRVTAFEAYRDMHSRAESSAPRRPEPAAERRPTREQLLQPKVETNRGDGPMDVDLTDPGRYAAGANGGVKGYVQALLGRGPR